MSRNLPIPEADYIAEVCRQNPLSETVDWLQQSDEDCYYTDRHLEPPPDAMPPLCACAAGPALLLQWNEELAETRRRGIFTDGPVLIIDQEWLDGDENAAPPAVILYLAKREEILEPPPYLGEPVEPGESPIRDLLSGIIPPVEVEWGRPDSGLGEKGNWLVRAGGPSMATVGTD